MFCPCQRCFQGYISRNGAARLKRTHIRVDSGDLPGGRSTQRPGRAGPEACGRGATCPHPHTFSFCSPERSCQIGFLAPSLRVTVSRHSQKNDTEDSRFNILCHTVQQKNGALLIYKHIANKANLILNSIGHLHFFLVDIPPRVLGDGAWF